LLWTIRVPDDRVEVNVDDARASIHLSDVDVGHYPSIPDALNGGSSVPAVVSFHILWSGVKQRSHLHDNQKKFDAKLIMDTATMDWSAHTKDFKFESDPANTSTTIFAAIGRERNGVFFSKRKRTER
jgi:hypothetical protein